MLNLTCAFALLQCLADPFQLTLQVLLHFGQYIRCDVLECTDFEHWDRSRTGRVSMVFNATDSSTGSNRQSQAAQEQSVATHCAKNECCDLLGTSIKLAKSGAEH